MTLPREARAILQRLDAGGVLTYDRGEGWLLDQGDGLLPLGLRSRELYLLREVGLIRPDAEEGSVTRYRLTEAGKEMLDG